MQTVVAVDVGGTKMLAALVDAQGHCGPVHRRHTPARAGGAAVVSALDDMVKEVQRDDLRDVLRGEASDAVHDKAEPRASTPMALGVCAAGVIDPHQARVLAATDAMPGWAGTDLRASLRSGRVASVHALNDVHAALLGERWLGSLRPPVQSAVMLTLGTGLGGAWMVQGRLQFGARFMAGHWGRTRVRQGDQWQSLEDRCSGTGLAQLARERGLALTDGRAVLAAAADGQDDAQAALDQWVEELAALLHNLRWTMDPEVVVLGGGLISAQAQWWPLLMQALAGLDLAVRPAELGEQAGLLGAARWALDQSGPAVA